jgi:hypothetical protein
MGRCVVFQHFGVDGAERVGEMIGGVVLAGFAVAILFNHGHVAVVLPRQGGERRLSTAK